MKIKIFLYIIVVCLISIPAFALIVGYSRNTAISNITETWGNNTGDDYTGVTQPIHGWAEEADPNDSNNSYSIYVRNGTSNDRETFMSFDLSAISGKTVVAASLYLNLSAAPTSMTTTVYSNQDAFTIDATWNCAADANHDGSCDVAWTGTRGRDTELVGVAFTSSSTTDIYYEFTSAELITYINTQVGSLARFILVDKTANDDLIDFWGRGETNGKRPYLSITYHD